MRRTLLFFALALFAAGREAAADPYVIADRANDAYWRIFDADASGVIDEPSEVLLYFAAGNAAGTIGPMNPTAMQSRWDGLTCMGDQINRNVCLTRDLNKDGDAMDGGESIMAADAGNASGVSFAFPTGAAFDPQGRIYVVNAGNAFGADGVYRMNDLNGDRDFQDAGEIEVYVGPGALGPGNGPYSPQELVFAPTDVATLGFLRNSSADLHGVYRCLDGNSDDDADDPGEFTVFWDVSAAGTPAAAGAALELDAARPGAMYTLQLAAGGVDLLIRLQDQNSDNDAQDAGESVVVFSTAEAGFTAIDIASDADGRVLLTDNSGKKVIALVDNDNDGLFMSPGERTDYFLNSLASVGDIRQISRLPAPSPCTGDWNADGATNTLDLNVVLTAFGCTGFNCPGDLDGDGETDSSDLNIVLTDFGCD